MPFILNHIFILYCIFDQGQGRDIKQWLTSNKIQTKKYLANFKALWLFDILSYYITGLD